MAGSNQENLLSFKCIRHLSKLKFLPRTHSEEATEVFIMINLAAILYTSETNLAITYLLGAHTHTHIHVPLYNTDYYNMVLGTSCFRDENPKCKDHTER